MEGAEDTARYAVLGNPVAHSLSPWIHAEFARQLGSRIDYGRVLCPLDGFVPSLRRFAQGGGRGCNVTVPFKFEAFPLAQQSTGRARLAQAANVLVLDAQGHITLADNSDGIGLVRAIEGDAGTTLAGRRILLIGAGGAAAGVLGPLLQARPSALVLANRTEARAQALAQRHRPWAQEHGVRLEVATLSTPGQGYDIVVNASASSLAGDEAPVPATVLRPDSLAIDLMYGAAARGFTRWAEAAGARATDGLGMLVEQAAEAYALWRGQHPQTAPVLQASRVHLRDKAAHDG
jgi:shikimate dehydrogenase